MMASKPHHHKTKTSVQDIINSNRMMEKPVLQNTNHLFSISGKTASKPQIGEFRNTLCLGTKRGLEMSEKKSFGDRNFRIKTKRNSSIKDIKKSPQERLDLKNVHQIGHKKNTKSLKLDQENLKKMLMERMQKRYENNQEGISKRALETVDLYTKTQRHFRTSSHNFFDSKSNGKLSQKKIVKKRKSRRGSRDGSQRKIKLHK